jgi:CSLREA domain-containing protein
MKSMVSLIAFLLCMTIGAVYASTMQAETTPSEAIVVNTTIDATDAGPGDGICESASGNQECTLRAAIQEANAHPDLNMIVLPRGTFSLTIPGGDEDESVTGDLDITESIDIRGEGFLNTIVDGNELDRVLDIANVHVSLTGVTIQNGLSLGPGGGIRALGWPSGTLTLDDVNVSNNTTQLNVSWSGGAGIWSSARLTITNSTIRRNHATGSGIGGGIFSNEPITPISQPGLVIENTVIADNIASYGGGVSAGCGSVVISNSTISDNQIRTDTAGGGVATGCSQAKMRIIGSTISGNTAGDGAGVYHSGEMLEIVNSTISGNTGGAVRGDHVLIKNTTIANNTISEALFGTFTLTNTILAFNVTVAQPGTRCFLRCEK